MLQLELAKIEFELSHDSKMSALFLHHQWNVPNVTHITQI